MFWNFQKFDHFLPDFCLDSAMFLFCGNKRPGIMQHVAIFVYTH